MFVFCLLLFEQWLKCNPIGCCLFIFYNTQKFELTFCFFADSFNLNPNKRLIYE